jgi:hypothetical protein
MMIVPRAGAVLGVVALARGYTTRKRGIHGLNQQLT